jgi:hypothetical protein
LVKISLSKGLNTPFFVPLNFSNLLANLSNLSSTTINHYQNPSLIERKRAMQAKPRKGESDRFLDCPHYEDCLDLAALRNWKALTCESCPIYTHGPGETSLATPEKEETARLCRECGKNPTIQPMSPLCASCIGKHARKEKDKKKSHKRRPKKKPPRPNRKNPHRAPMLSSPSNLKSTPQS